MDINIIAPINQLGYGIASTNIVLELMKMGHDVALWPIGGRVETLPPNYRWISEAIRKQDKFKVDAPSLKIWHEFDMGESIGRGYRFGMTFFELDELSSRAKHHLASLDKIIVASKWAKSILGFPNVEVVPLGVDRTIFKPGWPTGMTTVFLSIGKWEIRKGHDVIIDAFCQAFNPTDPVELLVVSDNPFISEAENKAWETSYLNSSMGKRVKIVHRYDSQYAIAKIMQSADCGVFPSRAEAWNLELLEMMSCGKPVITTNYSGHSEYVTPANAMIVDIDGMETAYDGIFFKGDGGRWAGLSVKSIDQIANYMLHVHNVKQGEGEAALYNEAGIETSKKFSWTNTATRLVEVLNG
jgi:glycosyltransferase involved in cell wall biosynthesis